MFPANGHVIFLQILSVSDSTASVLNGTQGLTVGNTTTTLTGATSTTMSGGGTTLQLNSSGANFNGAKVTGVADGTSTYDAVNYGQLQAFNSRLTSLDNEMSSGIAMSNALAGIPQVDNNKTFSLGAGFGNFSGQSALAVGASVRVFDNAVIKAGVGASDGNTSVSAGVGYSW